jgi:hypothetical protein
MSTVTGHPVMNLLVASGICASTFLLVLFAVWFFKTYLAIDLTAIVKATFSGGNSKIDIRGIGALGAILALFVFLLGGICVLVRLLS